MAISFNEKTRIFKLDAPGMTYAFMISETGHLAKLYCGSSVSGEGLEKQVLFLPRAFSPNPKGTEISQSLDVYPQEYGTCGVGDFHTPTFMVRAEDGINLTDPVYVSHRIFSGKNKLEGLPASFAEKEDVETLEITLTDARIQVDFILSYSIFKDSAVLARSARIVNRSKKTVFLEKAASLTLDFFAEKLELISFPGAWARERIPCRQKIQPGIHTLSSVRGLSSHQMNPSFILAKPETTETTGYAYGIALLYSGNFAAEIEKDQVGNIRSQIGINPQTFEWKLEPGAAFQTPECLLGFSANGFGGISHTFHDFFRTHLIRSWWNGKRRPILINNWEATYFNFNEEKILKIARKAAELGVEMLVLDDGWFGKRDIDNCSLGDWVCHRGKLPDGLGSMVKKINSLGLKFGLWFEPEMVSPDSDLFRAHPDWTLHVPGHTASEGRQQLVLDMSRPEVVDYLFQVITAVLDSANIEYIKWDANRHVTEAASAILPADRQKETLHRYVLGMYELHERLLTRYPKLLIEGCSGGGGRFDAGMLYYVPQIWTSDDTDAIARVRIQYGTSFFYPSSAMGAHVSAVPNHQTGRSTPFVMRGIAAMAGTFGYELDLNMLPAEEQTMVKTQVETFKKYYPLVASGNLYRLNSPLEDSSTAWLHVAKDRSEALFSMICTEVIPNPPPLRFRLQGLNPDAVYADDSGTEYSGALLMNGGLLMEVPNAASGSMQIHFRKIR